MNVSIGAIKNYIAEQMEKEKTMEKRFDSASIGYINIVNPDAEHISSDHSIIRYDQFVQGLFKQETYPMMMLHAAIGTCGEAGELADAIKKHVIYGKPLDRDNVVEELGDLRFYMQALMNTIGITEQEILQVNGYKLFKRYKGGTYSDKAAVERADKNPPNNSETKES